MSEKLNTTNIVTAVSYICKVIKAGNTKGESITALLTSCLTGLESAVWQQTIFL